MLRAIVAFAAGVCAVHAAPALPPAWLLAVCAATAACAALRRVLVPAAFVIGAAFATAAAAAVLADRLAPDRDRDVVRVVGTVVSLPEAGAQGARFAFAPDRALHPDLPARIRTGWYLDTPPPGAATRWRLTLRLRTPRGALNPAGFDYEQWLAARRIGATATVVEHPVPEPLVTARGTAPLTAWRAHVDRALTGALPPRARRGVIRGLAVGERGELTPHEWEVFARTGTAHLMAISGLHVGIVAAFVFAVAVAVARRVQATAHRAREAGLAAALVAAGLYAALAGFAVPTRRALCMLAVGAAWSCARRHAVAWTALVAALGAVLAADPLAPLTIGFWLSFGAVAAIVWQAAGRRASPPPLVQLVRVQYAVALGLLPLTLWFFQRGSLAAPVANLVAVPWFSLAVVPGVLGGAALATLGPPELAAACLRGVTLLVDFTWSALESIAAWPWAQRFTPRPPGWTIVAALAGAAVLLAPRGVPGRALVGALLCVPMLAWRPPAPPPGDWELTVLDVGQGLAAVVRTARHAVVYDAGPTYGPTADAGSRIVVPFLRASGVAAVDTLVISHAHDDHQGGVRALVDALPVARVLAGQPGAAPVRAKRCVAGVHWSVDGVSFRVLHPRGDARADANHSSCVVEVTGRGARALLPGDVEWPAELGLARPPVRVRPVDVVVVPHHGSTTSSTQRFVARTIPRTAIVAAAYGNRWGFPAAAVAGRWRAAGAELFVTGADGAVTVAAGVQGISPPVAQRRVRRAWWRAE